MPDDCDETVVHCPNPRCGIIFRPDPEVYIEGDTRCPKCGANFNTQIPPSVMRLGDYGEE
ncbi:MAG: IBR domain-containing protein [Dehalococcoidia bacterium]